MTGFDSAHFRQVMGHVPTCVTVITGSHEGVNAGITIGSFTSVSLDPPLVGFLPAKTADSWPVMAAAGRFCVNVLADDQGELCWRFAKDTEDRFAGLEWRPSPGGAPIFDGVVAWIDCTVHDVVDEGDHWFVVGLVEQLAVEREHAPMVFHRGKLGGIRLP